MSDEVRSHEVVDNDHARLPEDPLVSEVFAFLAPPAGCKAVPVQFHDGFAMFLAGDKDMGARIMAFLCQAMETFREQYVAATSSSHPRLVNVAGQEISADDAPPALLVPRTNP